MSEYQYYEFQAIDQPLTEEEQQAVARLSSRVRPHPRQAVFVYNWSSFPGNAKETLAKYYDAMLYMANWGSRQLAFRFPRTALDLKPAAVYCQPLIVQDYVSFSTVGEYVILNIEFDNDDGGDWAEGEGWLPAMLSLRDDILQGDYRALYLAWLKTVEAEDLLDSVLEPPLPPGLKMLSPALRTFTRFFAIDEMFIQLAAQASGAPEAPSEGWPQSALAQLPERERDAFLLRLAQGEPHLSVGLKRRLREILPLSAAEPAPRRTVGQIRREAKDQRERERRRRAEEAEEKRIRKLEALAKREAEAWTEVESLIGQMQAKSYDNAVRLLIELRNLAVYRGEEVAFRQRLGRIHEKYSRRSGLLRRLHEAGLFSP